ncbi:phosphoribosylaminoimidazolesuccinocarboxamide synthase [Verrucomicrobium spinosum]|uniref:phosphoribosylaminoimidazolesuccinocarboxamide synthase n=1 Tax=Verrucomicrobium spinosum TaxID=2736 RepID=UPI0001746899|nr:phosphoribosylaminoimidazolesuccinocarboxamide synthase [Verrucomicrobium spinosum]
MSTTTDLPVVRPSDLGPPIYVGSVQRLYAVPGRDDLMVCETTNAGSVFDVGSIFDIPGSDVARATFRHALYTRMAQPKTWIKVREAIQKEIAKPEASAEARAFLEDLLVGPLEKMVVSGANTHHTGMLDSVTGEITAGMPENPSTFNVVRRFPVMKPVQKPILGSFVYDYSMFYQAATYVIPLEYIVRFGITGGSSVLRKYASLSDADKKTYENELGLSQAMQAWQFLPRPIFDLTSKHEPEDRNVTKQEAALMSGMEADAFVSTIKLSLLGAWAVRQLLDEIGLLLWDIKWEFAVDEGEFFFVDTIDTDSFRATAFLETEGKKIVLHYNKQSMRDYYKIAEATWFAGVNDAKKIASKTGTPFTKVLKEGQAEGKWPHTPVVHPDFLALQAKKMDIIRQHVLGNTEPEASKAALREVGEAEVDFYRQRGLFEEYCKANAI